MLRWWLDDDDSASETSVEENINTKRFHHSALERSADHGNGKKSIPEVWYILPALGPDFTKFQGARPKGLAFYATLGHHFLPIVRDLIHTPRQSYLASVCLQ